MCFKAGDDRKNIFKEGKNARNIKFQGIKTVPCRVLWGCDGIMEIFLGLYEQVSHYRFTRMSMASSQVNKLSTINESLNILSRAISGRLCNAFSDAFLVETRSDTMQFSMEKKDTKTGEIYFRFSYFLWRMKGCLCCQFSLVCEPLDGAVDEFHNSSCLGGLMIGGLFHEVNTYQHREMMRWRKSRSGDSILIKFTKMLHVHFWCIKICIVRKCSRNTFRLRMSLKCMQCEGVRETRA